MISTRSLFTALLAFCSASSFSYSADTQSLKGPYVGQKTPGLTPEPFYIGAPTEDYHDSGGVFSADMSEFYFTRRFTKDRKKREYVYTLEAGEWTLSEAGMPWTGFISPDGKTMYRKKHYRNRTVDGWSEAKSINLALDDYDVMRTTISDQGLMVFDERGKNGYGFLRYSEIVDGVRQPPKVFNAEINSGRWTAHPFIAPDESYMIWDSERLGGFGDSDLYISFRQEDGSWGSPINFGEDFNTEGADAGGYVTPDGKYLFYCRNCQPPHFDRVWVDAQIISRLKEQDVKLGSQ